MMSEFNLRMPKEIYSGENSLKNIKTIASKYKKIALFTDKGIQGAGILDNVTELLKEINVDFIIFNELPAEPTCDEAQGIIDEFKRVGADFIVAVGGGSVMDIAKLASICVTDDYSVRDLLDNPTEGKKMIKTLMIPTTAGTGSEATPNSIVSVPEKELKIGIVNNDMIPDYVILDAQMIKKLPFKIAAATGVDALAHAIECFTSNKATPFSNMFALEALELIINNIEEACLNVGAMQSKNNMLIGAFYAGVAITASGTTAVHALSYPLGGKYHIPHGVSNAMMLVPVMKFNEPLCRGLFAKVYDRIVKNGVEKTEEDKSLWLINKLDSIVKKLEIPTSVKEYGVKLEDLDILVELGMNVQRLLVNNMREVTKEDARKLYLEIM